MTVLPIPNPLTSNYVAPAGTFTAPAQVNVNASCTVDLSACTINGTGAGFLLKPKAGVALIAKLGIVTNMQGIVLGLVGAGGRASAQIIGGTTQNVVCLINYKSNDGGRLDGLIRNMNSTGLGVAIRTYGSAEAYSSTLYGGANPASGDPGAVRGLDLNDTATVVADQKVIVQDCSIMDFAGGNSDGVSAEETVAYLEVSRSYLANFSDAAVDSKANLALVADNTFEGSYGVRITDSHIGRLYSVNNLYSVPTGVYALQASSGYGADPQHPTDPGLTSLRDQFTLNGGLVARAVVACQGSTGFFSTRCGVIRLLGASWTPAGGTPWIAPHSVCSTDGLDYFPSVVNG